jgi:hypothetical protein
MLDTCKWIFTCSMPSCTYTISCYVATTRKEKNKLIWTKFDGQFSRFSPFWNSPEETKIIKLWVIVSTIPKYLEVNYKFIWIVFEAITICNYLLYKIRRLDCFLFIKWICLLSSKMEKKRFSLKNIVLLDHCP